MIKRRKFTKGVRLKPTDEALVDEGDISVGETEKKLKVKADGADRNVVTEDQEQPLDNKRINTPIIDGTVSGTAIETDVTNNTSDKVPSAEAVKTYVDAKVASKDEASEISYDPTGNAEVSGADVQAALDSVDTQLQTKATDAALTNHLNDTVDAHDASAISNVASGNLSATDVQGALNELQSDVDTRALASDLTETDTNTDDLVTLSGVAENSTNLGTFTGTTITDAQTIKSALQELETAVEGSTIATIDDIGDVDVPSPTDGQVLTYVNSSGNWEAVDSAGDASAVTYTPSTLADWDSDTDPGNVDAALDQLAERVDDNEINITSNDTDINNLQTRASINHLKGNNSNFKDTVGDWSAYADAADTVPVDGTGGSPTTTIERSADTSLRGDANGLITKGAANRQGEGAGVPFTIDEADQAKKQTISFDYIPSSGYEDNDIKVFVYDVTNSNLIRVNGEDLKANSGSNTHYAQFQTAPDSTSYRLILHVSSTNASAYTVRIDNVKVGPTNLAFGTIVTDWSDLNVTLQNISTSALTARYRRVGDTLHGYIDATVTSVSGLMGFSLDDFSTDDNKIPDNFSNVGTVGAYDESSAQYTGTVLAKTDDTFALTGGTSTNTWDATDPFTWASGDNIRIEFQVPIAGWSSNTRMSEDLGGRDITVEGRGNGAGSVTPLVTDIDFTEVEDNTASWNGSVFTAPETATYVFTGSVHLNASAFEAVESFIDGTVEDRIGPASTGTVHPFNGKVDLIKDQELSFRLGGSGAKTLSDATDKYHFVRIHKLASPQTILETETVAARYTSNSGQAIPHNSVEVVEFENLIEDTHNAYNTTTGVYTVPANGWYLVTSGIRYTNATYSAGTSFELQIRIDGARVDSDTYETEVTTNSRISLGLSRLIPINRGQEVTMQSYQNEGSPQNLDADATRNTFSIARIK